MSYCHLKSDRSIWGKLSFGSVCKAVLTFYGIFSSSWRTSAENLSLYCCQIFWEIFFPVFSPKTFVFKKFLKINYNKDNCLTAWTPQFHLQVLLPKFKFVFYLLFIIIDSSSVSTVTAQPNIYFITSWT